MPASPFPFLAFFFGEARWPDRFVFFLGGDLGIDSREMFEVWYELEERLGIKVEEGDKRDRYTLQDVVTVLSGILGDRALPA